MYSSLESQHTEVGTDEKVQDTKVVNNKKLQTRTAVKLLLEGKLKNHVCRYCLNVDSCLWELDRVMNIAVKGIAYTVTIRTMVASFHHIKVGDDPNFPNKICETCLEQILSCYIFTQQCERAERALRNCFDDVDEKISKLDPLDQSTKKRGRQKRNPNYNTLCVAHEHVIDYAEPIISLINATSSITEDYKLEINPNECSKCWQIFPNIALLKNHEKIHPKTMWFHCRLCGRSFSKAYHLKKHINSAHKKPTPKSTEIENFKCKECNYVSEHYSQHLQHVEKHKFKTFMNHLVENKLNKICAVCLDKGTNLTDIDKMVCFHGGMPGLTGDVNLKSILRSTITNKNMNKYQELHVSNQANVFKFTNQKVEATTTSSLPTLSKAIFVSLLMNTEENREEFAKKSHVLLFSEPIKQIMPLINVSNISDNDNSELQKKAFNGIQDTPAINSVSELNIDCRKTVDHQIICHKCWIFGKTCTCSDADQRNSRDQGKCNYCWIFKHANKCCNCHKLNTCARKDEKININPTVTKEVSKYGTTAHKNNNKLNTNKRKRSSCGEPYPIVPKRHKLYHETVTWLCKICLTKNTENTQKCLCCDWDKILNDDTKFNFPIRVSDSKEEVVSVSNYNNDNCATVATNEDFKQKEICGSDNSKVTEDFGQAHPDLSDDSNSFNKTMNIINKTDNDTEMDTEQPLLDANDNNYLQINMEICEDNNLLLNTKENFLFSAFCQSRAKIVEPIQTMHNAPNALFTIGSGSAKSKKPLNRKAGTSRN